MNKNIFNFSLMIATLTLLLFFNFSNLALAQDINSGAPNTSSVAGIMGTCASESLEFKIPKHFGEAYKGAETFTYETLTAEELMKFSKVASAIDKKNVRRGAYKTFLKDYNFKEARFMEIKSRLIFLYDSSSNKVPYSGVAEILGVDDSEIAFCDYELVKNNMPLVEKAIKDLTGNED